jgi:hypothetical protein
VAETWFDKDGNMIPGGEAVVNGLLQPNEVTMLEVRTPVNLKMLQSRLQFSHANGTVNAKRGEDDGCAGRGGGQRAGGEDGGGQEEVGVRDRD